MKDHTDKTDHTDEYVAPAIERREDVAGLLSVQKGSYCAPGMDK